MLLLYFILDYKLKIKFRCRRKIIYKTIDVSDVTQPLQLLIKVWIKYYKCEIITIIKNFFHKRNIVRYIIIELINYLYYDFYKNVKSWYFDLMKTESKIKTFKVI